VPKQNYNQARKEKERARKARQQEKQQRRSARVSPADETAQQEPSAALLPVQNDPTSEGGR